MATPSFQQVAVLGLYTETPLHCGAESGFGYVDLPVQRERHTHYPVIPASTLKGRLKDEVRGGLKESTHRELFGALAKGEDDVTTPGRIAFGDGILVAFPVRSTGVPFRWVTCPWALERAFRALGRTELELAEPAPGRAWGAEASAGDIAIEELVLSVEGLETFFGQGEPDGAPVSALLDLLPPEDAGFGYLRQVFPRRLLVLRDADFEELVETATETITRIKLTALKTTTNIPEGLYEDEINGEDRKGNMFVEEVVPPDTLFLAGIRGGDGHWEALEKALPPVVQLGGGETIGRGLTHLVPRRLKRGA